MSADKALNPQNIMRAIISLKKNCSKPVKAQ